MRHQALIQDSVSVLDLWKMLPQWINRHHPFDGERRYVAKDIDASFNDLPTLTVEMSGARGLIATYKCNIVQVYEPHTSWLVLSPLVVIWHQDRETRGPEMGRIMIDHALGAISDFHQIHGSVGHRIVVASGNLTVAKGGRPFFEGIGWEIIEPDARRPSRLYDGVNAMTGPLDAIAAQIEAILAPLRASGKLADEMLSFAIWRPASEVKRHV